MPPCRLLIDVVHQIWYRRVVKHQGRRPGNRRKFSWLWVVTLENRNLNEGFRSDLVGIYDCGSQWYITCIYIYICIYIYVYTYMYISN